jgi:hypothetical protein
MSWLFRISQARFTVTEGRTIPTMEYKSCTEFSRGKAASSAVSKTA